ncbi:hypothetical protein R1sor_002371 [Riccia sorocarpa]|uniref:Peptide-methionine (R)-S-oxide reductase n=1 Tax=Riccia sorocarpa TaxID=122646 RepID=A0ABD3H4N7_9MARC
MAAVGSKLLLSAKAPTSALVIGKHNHKLIRHSTSLPSRSSSVSISGLSVGSRSDLLKRRGQGFAGARRVPGVAVAMASSEAGGGSISRVQKSEEEWRTILNPEQFRILREKGTEWAGTGKYNKFKEEGLYECAGCGTPLYKSVTKFDSGCGWPAFYEGLPGAITETADPDGRRIEITCTACGGHLGHVFKGEGFATPTNERHCVNSISLKFTPANN